MSQEKPSMRSIAPFGLRMQEPLRKLLEESAEIAGRSLNSEIVARLTESLSVSRQHATIASEPRDQRGLSTNERLILLAVKDLTPEAQLGLITFLRGVAAQHKKPGSRS